jgi:hypothetical protein
LKELPRPPLRRPSFQNSLNHRVDDWPTDDSADLHDWLVPSRDGIA